MYRRVLALLAAEQRPFVVAGAFGLSLQIGRLVDGELELYFRAEDGPPVLGAIEAAGLKIDLDETHARARITYGDHRCIIRWALPAPLEGAVDQAWFDHSRRVRFLGLRLRAAPVEEMLWLRIALPGTASVGDLLIGQLLLARGAKLDWGRVLMRMSGQEALLLSHIFLFWHQYPESGREIPLWVITALRGRLDQADRSSDSWAPAEQSLHRWQ